MKPKTAEILGLLLKEFPALCPMETAIASAFVLLLQCYRSGGKILTCGNGGSAADADHIVGELMKGFVKSRRMTDEEQQCFVGAPELIENLQRCIPAISLCAHTALATAYCNDKSPDMVFAQQVFGYMQPRDVLLGLSTSGNSMNVVNAAKVAKAIGGQVISLTGKSGGLLSKLSDVTIKVPDTAAYRIQQLHLPIYHGLCLMLEEELFDD